jgi:hypothetical protein
MRTFLCLRGSIEAFSPLEIVSLGGSERIRDGERERRFLFP